jgi:hypothetical protein
LIQFIDRINAANDPATRPWIATDFPDGGRHPCGSKRSSRRASPAGGIRSWRRTAFFRGASSRPPGFRIMAACPNAVIGAWKDENDVERARIYPVIRQAQP